MGNEVTPMGKEDAAFAIARSVAKTRFADPNQFMTASYIKNSEAVMVGKVRQGRDAFAPSAADL